MKFQTLAVLGLLALTTVTAQSASAQLPNQTHLTATDAAMTSKSRSLEVRTPTVSATQTLNLTHLTSSQVSTLQVNRVSQAVQKTASFSLNPTQSSSDDTAAIGINTAANSENTMNKQSVAQAPTSPIVDVVVHRQGNRTSHATEMTNPVRSTVDLTHPTALMFQSELPTLTFGTV